jgi:hypothetical protein
MAYGTIKVDTITFTDGGIDKSVSISGLVQNPTFTGNVTVTGTISGNTVQGQTISGVTVTGTTANFTSGNFTNISGGTHTITSGVFASGTAANPSISFVSDPNSGLYSPGADQVAISTNGTGRLFVDASGNVILGSGTASFPLEVKKTGVDSTIWGYNVAQFADATANNTGLRVATNTSTSGLTQLVAATASAASQFGFWTYNGSAWGERMRLDSSGRLGLGTSSPTRTLDVAGGIHVGTGTNDAVVGYNEFTAGVFGIGTASTVPLVFGTTSLERVRIDSSGRVGIGTTSPAVAFQVGATGSGGAAIDTTNSALHGTFGTGGGLSLRAQISSSSGGGDIFLGGSSRGDANVNSIVFSTANTSRAKIDANGYFTVSSNRFNGFEFIDSGATIYHSFGSGGNLTLRAQTTATAGGGEIFLGGSTRGDSNVNAIVFSGANSERARIDSSGRLLVGTSSARSNFYNSSSYSPRLQLESANDGASSSIALISVSGGGFDEPNLVFAKSRGSAIGNNTIVVDGDDIGNISFQASDGSEFVVAASILAEVDGTPGANDMPGRLVFSTTADGASSPTERMRIPNGGGLSVGSTVNPNALTQASGIRLGSSTIANHDFTNITTSPVNIANGVGIGGLAFVQAYNTANGAQYTGIVMWRANVVAVVSESNSLGFGLTYTVSGSALYLQTASGTISGSVITLAG